MYKLPHGTPPSVTAQELSRTNAESSILRNPDGVLKVLTGISPLAL